MRITLEADYAVRIVDCLTSAKEILCAKTLSERTGVNLRFALKILRKLCKAGFVCSHQGIQGGYELRKRPEDISLKDVIEAIDGPIAINKCQTENVCSRIGNPDLCIYHSIFSDISKSVEDKLSTITFDKK